jgi:hypothetical protein
MAALARPSQKIKPLADGRLVSVPTATADPGMPGDFARDATNFYIYTGDGVTHSWRKIAHSAL